MQYQWFSKFLSIPVYIFLSVSACLCLSLSISVCPSKLVYICLCLFVCVWPSMPVYVFICVFLCRLMSMAVCVYLCLPMVRLCFLWMSVCLCVSMFSVFVYSHRSARILGKKIATAIIVFMSLKMCLLSANKLSVSGPSDPSDQLDRTGYCWDMRHSCVPYRRRLDSIASSSPWGEPAPQRSRSSHIPW